MSGILFDAAGVPRKFSLSELSSAPTRNEKWLQKTLYEHPELLPLEEIDPAAREFVPICRELALTGARSSVFLDIFGVSICAGRFRGQRLRNSSRSSWKTTPTVVFIVAAVFVTTIAGRIARRRIRARYACRPARAAGS
jgi:hypothetical protein